MVKISKRQNAKMSEGQMIKKVKKKNQEVKWLKFKRSMVKFQEVKSKKISNINREKV